MKKILSHWNLPKVQTFVISILIGLYKMLIKNPFTGIWIVRKHELGFTSLTAEREWTDWVQGTFLKSSESYTSRNGTKWFYLSLSDLFFCVSLPVTTIRVSERDRKMGPQLHETLEFPQARQRPAQLCPPWPLYWRPWPLVVMWEGKKYTE